MLLLIRHLMNRKIEKILLISVSDRKIVLLSLTTDHTESI